MCKANDIAGDGNGVAKAESLSEWDKKEVEAEGITRRLAKLAARCEAGTLSKADVQAMLLNLVERERIFGDPGDMEEEMLAELGRWM